MPDPRLLDRDPTTGKEVWYHYDEVDGSFTLETRENLGGMVEVVKNLASAADDAGHSRDGRLAAIYPMTMWYKLKKDGVLDDQKAYRRWLNDPENRGWRVWQGKV